MQVFIQQMFGDPSIMRKCQMCAMSEASCQGIHSLRLYVRVQMYEISHSTPVFPDF